MFGAVLEQLVKKSLVGNSVFLVLGVFFLLVFVLLFFCLFLLIRIDLFVDVLVDQFKVGIQCITFVDELCDSILVDLVVVVLLRLRDCDVLIRVLQGRPDEGVAPVSELGSLDIVDIILGLLFLSCLFMKR